MKSIFDSETWIKEVEGERDLFWNHCRTILEDRILNHFTARIKWYKIIQGNLKEIFNKKFKFEKIDEGTFDIDGSEESGFEKLEGSLVCEIVLYDGRKKIKRERTKEIVKTLTTNINYVPHYKLKI